MDIFTITQDFFGKIDLSISEAYYNAVFARLDKGFVKYFNKKLTYYHKLDRLFQNVNPDNLINNHKISEDRVKVKESFYCSINGKNLNWLELGPWSSFPDTRVEQIIKEYGLKLFIRLDVAEEFSPEIVGNACDLPFKNDSFEVISSNSVLEHIAHPEEVLRESYRCLSSGGYFVATMPFHFIEHGYPSDYVRLTPNYFKDVGDKIGYKNIFTHKKDFSGCYYLLHNLVKSNCAYRIPNDSLEKILHVNNLLILFLNSALESYNKQISEEFYVSVEVYMRKPGVLEKREKLF